MFLSLQQHLYSSISLSIFFCSCSWYHRVVNESLSKFFSLFVFLPIWIIRINIFCVSVNCSLISQSRSARSFLLQSSRNELNVFDRIELHGETFLDRHLRHDRRLVLLGGGRRFCRADQRFFLGIFLHFRCAFVLGEMSRFDRRFCGTFLRLSVGTRLGKIFLFFVLPHRFERKWRNALLSTTSQLVKSLDESLFGSTRRRGTMRSMRTCASPSHSLSLLPVASLMTLRKNQLQTLP